jgi:hypothetical protein
MMPTPCRASRGGPRRHPVVSADAPPSAAERLLALPRPAKEAKV